MSAYVRRSPAVRLLECVLQSGTVDLQIVQGSLGVAPTEFEAFRSGATRMPAEVRLRLAAFVATNFPEYARVAHRVEDEAKAQIAFRTTTTVTHLNSPSSRFK